MAFDIKVDFADIDRQLNEWKQGDFTCEQSWFFHAANPNKPLTNASFSASHSDSPSSIESECEGLVVVTQTCDIVRTCQERPFIEVSPLVKVSSSDLAVIKRGQRPRFGYIPGAESLSLVADLDCTMTVEKGLVADWNRTTGTRSDAETRDFANALARKRHRYAFPTDFGKFAGGLATLIKGKHNRQSLEGEAIRSLRQIRIRATPSWNADHVSLEFYFIAEDNADRDALTKHYEKWMKLIAPSGRFGSVHGTIVFLDDISARDIVESDALDLDHLSI